MDRFESDHGDQTINWREFVSFISAREEAAQEQQETGNGYSRTSQQALPSTSSSRSRRKPKNRSHPPFDDVASWPGGSGGGHWKSARLDRNSIASQATHGTPEEWVRTRGHPIRTQERNGGGGSGLNAQQRFSGGLFEENITASAAATINTNRGGSKSNVGGFVVADDVRASTAPYSEQRRSPLKLNPRTRMGHMISTAPPRGYGAKPAAETRYGGSRRRRDVRTISGPDPGRARTLNPDTASALRVLDDLLDDQRELETFLVEEFARRAEGSKTLGHRDVDSDSEASNGSKRRSRGHVGVI
ncbi:unnamed protein product [Sphacelaria rigidula]